MNIRKLNEELEKLLEDNYDDCENLIEKVFGTDYRLLSNIYETGVYKIVNENGGLGKCVLEAKNLKQLKIKLQDLLKYKENFK